MPVYRRKSVRIRAVEITLSTWKSALNKKMEDRTEDQQLICRVRSDANGFVVDTSSGPSRAVTGDFIVSRSPEDAVIIKRDNFLDLYELD